MTDATSTDDAVTTPRPSKAALVTKLLSRPRGASLSDIVAVTGWQPHSIRAFLAGLRKKGVNLEREQRRDGATGYRIIKVKPAPAASTSTAQ